MEAILNQLDSSMNKELDAYLSKLIRRTKKEQNETIPVIETIE